ncbi:hypothetical protein ACIBQ1_08700 [Nonomuraea sp. NPDC050153]|uniref:hypothetical protein n=1 Tax=Nonomuraea sp. NPDC050153 TaxID=3364359 RepID=UPI0037AC854E
MTRPPGTEPGEPAAAAPVLRDSVVGGDNIQITSARDVTIISRGARGRSLVRIVAAGVVLALCGVAAGMWPTLADTARDLAGAPVLAGTVTSRLYVTDSVATYERLPPGDHAVLLRGPNFKQLTELLSRHHAARVGEMDVVIVLQGRRSRPVRIIDVRPRVRRSGPVPTGTCLTVPSQGDGTEYKVKANLDLQTPEGGGSRYLPKSIDLADGERVTVEFSVTAARRWYEWDIEVIYVYKADEQPTSSFFGGADGQPFRITGEAKTYATVYGDPSYLGAGYRAWGRNEPCRRPPRP